MIVGNYYENVKGVSYVDPETNRIRVKSLGNSSLPDGVMIECSKPIRTSHPVGTHFRTENVKVCKKPNGRIYLRAKDQMIYPMD